MSTPAPLVVYRDTVICDGPRPHEVTLVTDCARGYAFGNDTDAEILERDGTEIIVRCEQTAPHREVCDGHARFNLDTEGTWTADPDARGLVVDHGREMPR